MVSALKDFGWLWMKQQTTVDQTWPDTWKLSAKFVFVPLIISKMLIQLEFFQLKAQLEPAFNLTLAFNLFELILNLWKVEIRGTSEKLTAEGGGQTRNIYSQRHLSPHRMMHFGRKKAIRPLPPLILSPQVYDLNQQQDLQQQLLPISMLDRLPYLFSVQLDRGQTLEELPSKLNSEHFIH